MARSTAKSIIAVFALCLLASETQAQRAEQSTAASRTATESTSARLLTSDEGMTIIGAALESNRLVPARETCENCHWPQNFAGARLRVFTKFADDETNTRTNTVLLMLIGGNKIAGIHGAHIGPGVDRKSVV